MKNDSRVSDKLAKITTGPTYVIGHSVKKFTQKNMKTFHKELSKFYYLKLRNGTLTIILFTS